MLKQMSPLNQRLAVGIALVCFILVTICLSYYPYFRSFFVLVVAAVVGGAVWEFYQMTKGKGLRPLESLGVLGSVVYVVAVFLSVETAGASVLLPGVTLALLLFVGFLHFFFKQGRPLFDLSVTFFAIAYLTIPLSLLVNVNFYFPAEASQDGRWWLIYLILVTKITDTGGFFFGKFFGRTTLTAVISPKKTWEGAFGGIVCALVSATVYFMVTEWLFPSIVQGVCFWGVLVLAAALAVFAQLGDLSESILKRDAGVKDSNQLPGLGGILDVVDSLVFTTPIVYMYLKLIYP